MVIKSYLVYPHQEKTDELKASLSKMPECEIIPALNHDLLVLVTETEDESAEKALIARLEALPALQNLALVSGHNTAAEFDIIMSR